MWELITANKIRSVVLLTIMAMVLIAAGMLIGGAVQPGGWLVGALIAFVMWIVMAVTSYYGGDAIFLSASGAREIQREDHPTLFNIVEEMTIASGLPKVPRIYIIDDPRPNAFATGRDPMNASVAVTAGLLNMLDRDEVQGVIAHELAHVKNRDIFYVMMAAVMIGVIALLSDMFIRYLWWGGRFRTQSRGRGADQAQALLMVAAILFAILGPIAAQLLYLALSRRREYLADACGASFTRYPEGLASALVKISSNPGLAEQKNRAMAPMYIVNPLQGTVAVASLFSTHPPTEERVRILRSMGGASLADYEEAARKAAGKHMIPSKSLAASRPVGVRPPWMPDERRQPVQTPQERVRETTDALRRASNYAFIACACGVTLKVPPEFQGDRVRCPRCQRVHSVTPA